MEVTVVPAIPVDSCFSISFDRTATRIFRRFGTLEKNLSLRDAPELGNLYIRPPLSFETRTY